YRLGRSNPLAQGRTDGAGLVRLTFGRVPAVRVRVASDDRIGAVKHVDLDEGDTTEVDVPVVPAFRLSGVVRRADGRPVPGAAVYLDWLVESNRPHRISHVQADGEGRFAFPPARVPDAPVIRVYAMGGNEPGGGVDLPTRGGRIEGVIVTLDPATFVSGRCVDEQGRPLSGVRVRGIFPMTGEITFTNRQGWFRMKVPASGGGLIFWIKGRVQSGLRDLRGTDGKLNVGDVLIPEGGVLAGRVVRVGGRPAEGAQLIICDPVTLHGALHAKLGGDGAFRSELIGPGDHTIIVRDGGDYGEGGMTCWFVFRGYFAGATDIEITLPEGTQLDMDSNLVVASVVPPSVAKVEVEELEEEELLEVEEA
ncbi:MAG: carboxypeptidase regulatory-like domain-containing protein, partial [Phycisphaeraceae bacterium]|nr:carboxypeptidase regulatory-like domain-containing protein [Phycisphaeraceae bacterium]